MSPNPEAHSSAGPSAGIHQGRRGSALIGVVTVIKEEFDQASAMLGASQNLPDSPYYVRALADASAYDLVLRNLGDRGNDSSASRTLALIEDFRPNYVLLVGIAGGVKGRDSTELGHIVVPDFIDGYEMRKFSGGRAKKRAKLTRLLKSIFSKRGERHSGENSKRAKARDQPSYRLVRSIAEPIANSDDWLSRVNFALRPNGIPQKPQVIFGPLIFGEKILGDRENEYQRSILDEFDNALAVDMESGGVGLALYESRITKHYNPLYLIIRGISDLTNEPSNNEQRSKCKPYAAHVAAAFAAEVVEKLIAIG
jgi:nucleoside phosphorylase